MREILLRSCPVMLWVIAAAEALFVARALRGWKRSKNILYLLTALVAFGLFYDALILALGGVLKEGTLLLALSRLRFVFHGALIPLLFAICAYALGFNKTWMRIAWVFTGVLIVLGVAESFATDLSVQHVAGILRCTSGEGTPGWAQAVSGVLSYGTVVPLILAGVIVWIRQKTPSLFLAGFLMFAFSALGPATGNFDLIFYISMFGEVCMALFFLLYASNREKTNNNKTI